MQRTGEILLIGLFEIVLMKRAVSISLGSSQRDHIGEITLEGETIQMERRGTDGSISKMIEEYKKLDGKVEAFGAGGFMFAFEVGDRVWPIRTSKKITKHIHKTPIVDGHGVKNTIERHALQMVWEDAEKIFEGLPKTAMVTAAVDRFGMTMSVVDAGFDAFYADLAFGLGIPIKIKSIKNVHRLARLMMPIVRQFPFSWLYPLGEKQETYTPKYTKYFEEATLIAGDFLYTKKYAPYDMTDKVILTNTTTTKDMEEFKKRGVRAIISTTPNIGGRTFGTNVLEAAITAHSELGRPLNKEEMKEYIDKLNLKPEIHILNEF